MDTPLSESRFADMLEGWVDEEREAHDEHDVAASFDSHEHDEEHEHDEANSENSQQHEDNEGILCAKLVKQKMPENSRK